MGKNGNLDTWTLPCNLLILKASKLMYLGTVKLGWEPVLGGARALPGDRSLCEGRCSSEFAAILQVKIRQWVSDMRRLMPILW